MKHARSVGQALMWFTVALPLFLSAAGLAIDGGLLLASRRQLQNVADGAARAGATRLDLDRLRSSAGAEVQLDRTLAAATARAYLADGFSHQGAAVLGPSAQVDVGPRRVHVRVEGSLHTAFLRLFHIDPVPVQASAEAEVQYGIRNGGGG